MSQSEFVHLATAYLPAGDLERFASNVFTLFDEDKNGYLDFGEFALACSAQDSLSCRDRLVSKEISPSFCVCTYSGTGLDV